MSRIDAPKRGRGGARRADFSDLRDILKDGRIWCQLGVVSKPGLDSHWERTAEGDILVHVETMPRGLELLCRLGSAAGGNARGLWDIPPVGTEVIVAIPDGEPAFQPTIVTCLSSGAAPARVDASRTLLVGAQALELDAPAIRLGGEQATQAALKGDAFDSAANTFFTALNTYAVAIQAVADPSNLATPTLTTAINAFKSAITSAKSTVVKIK